MEMIYKDNVLIINLDDLCTIINVESETDMLRNLPGEVKVCQVNASAVKEIDTAYLQLLLSLKSTMEAQDTDFRIEEKSIDFKKVLELYGCNI